MKPTKKIIALTICLTLCKAHNMYAFWSDLDAYMQEHHRLMQNFEKSMSLLFQAHTKDFYEPLQSHSLQKPQNAQAHYQKNISTIVIENKCKSIQIHQTHDANKTQYNIEVYNKSQNKDQTTEKTTDDIKTELQALQSYIQESQDFISPEHVIHTLQECIDQLNQKRSSQSVTTSIETNNHRINYTIKIQHNIESETTQPKNKKIKSKKIKQKRSL